MASDYDSLGGRESPYKEYGKSNKKDWEGVTLFVNEPVYEYSTNVSKQLIRQDYDADIMDFVKTLPYEELIESLATLSEKELVKCLGLYSTYAE